MTSNATAIPVPQEKRPLGKSFTWLMLGAFISQLGDQFTLIGLLWLTLKLTNDPMALGGVMAMIGIPRALFILLGGAVVDRYSPKTVLMLSKYANTALLALLAFLVYSQQLSLPILYSLSIAIGLASAFAIPAGTSILPFVVKRDKLRQANGTLMGIRQLTFFVGPILAGFTIAHFGTEPGASNLPTSETGIAESTGLAFVFALDALTFLISSITLVFVKARQPSDETTATTPDHVFKLLFQGIKNLWRDSELRALFSYLGLIQVFVTGPMLVGLPLFSEQHLDHGAASFGIIMSAHGGGVLIGAIIAGAGLRLGFNTLGKTMLSVDILVGFALALLAMIHSTLTGSALILLVGILGGIMQVRVFSWIQGRTHPSQMGRVMSFFMFIATGVAPLSASLAGWILTQADVAALFVGSGVLLSLTALVSLSFRSLRSVGPAQ